MFCVSIAIEEIRNITAKNVDRNEGVSERQVKIHEIRSYICVHVNFNCSALLFSRNSSMWKLIMTCQMANNPCTMYISGKIRVSQEVHGIYLRNIAQNGL